MQFGPWHAAEHVGEADEEEWLTEQAAFFKGKRKLSAATAKAKSGGKTGRAAGTLAVAKRQPAHSLRRAVECQAWVRTALRRASAFCAQKLTT